MADLSIKQIKEKQKQLKKDLEKLLEDYKEETGLHVLGNIVYKYKKVSDESRQHCVILTHPNPFK